MNRIERVGRGAVATLFAIVIAAISHLIAGSQMPSLLAVLITIVVALPLSVALAGVRLSLIRLFAVVLASQALFHFSFSMIGATASGAAASAMTHSSHSMHTAGSLIQNSGAAGVSNADASMWTAHVVAALATFVLLAFGERAFVTIATIVVAALAALRGYSLKLAGSWPAPVALLSADVHPLVFRVTRTHTRRGPPAFFA